jgi:hypothetical protein
MKKLPRKNKTNKKLLLENISKHTDLTHYQIAEMLGLSRYSLNYRLTKGIPLTFKELDTVFFKIDKKYRIVEKFKMEIKNECM